ncbi:CDP-diacylglycerol-inositol 3-phosphatidyltransferase [Gaertneriomyces sp. JEL0708]|nr:CDP-diacylglycerol-inositol 3-phosphatidyltransferase [Gaertneriomyces sp. JEL0708]
MFRPHKTKNVFLFVPNLIGYARVILMFAALHYLTYDARIAMSFYTISCLLDALDGHAARYFQQTSRFGAVLDMVTDRSTTACLLVYLARQFPQFTLLFQSLIALDLSSHYLQMYSSLALGQGSHKNVDPKKTSWLLRQYYTNNKVLFSICAGNELFFIALYLVGQWHVDDKGAQLAWPAGSWIPAVHGEYPLGYIVCISLAALMFPIFAIKQFLNVVQMVGASRNLARLDKLTNPNAKSQ